MLQTVSYYAPKLRRKREPKIPTREDIINLIVKAVEHIFIIDDINAESKKRVRETCVYPRQVADALLKRYTNMSYAKIGIRVGSKDNATVIHSIKVITDSLDTFNKTGHDDLAVYYLMCEEEYLKRLEMFRDG